MAALSENPTSVRVRNLEPWVIQTHYHLAQNEGISLEAYLRILLQTQALKAQHEMADDLDQVRADLADQFGTDFPNGADLVRAVRAETAPHEADA